MAKLNPFFDSDHRTSKRPLPRRLYGYVISRGGTGHLLLDAIDADWFDERLERQGGLISAERWAEIALEAPVFALEIARKARPGNEDSVRRLLSGWPLSRRWVEVSVEPNPAGLANLYLHINGEPVRADVDHRLMDGMMQQAIRTATDLTPYIEQDATIEGALPASQARQVLVLDVGQASANAVVDSAGHVVAYVDLGAPVLSNTHTWPRAMSAPCFTHHPTVILSHWHYDHFQLANLQPAALTLTWVAPFQVLGAGPQSVMAAAIATAGRLMVWNSPGRVGLSRTVELERCIGNSINRSGIASWIKGPMETDPILLPGDAGYIDIPSLPGRRVQALAVPHHGGISPGTPPSGGVGSVVRIALSYGHRNTHGHPLIRTQSKLKSAGWVLGPFPGVHGQERRTEDRTGGPGGGGLGHVSLHWPGYAPPPRVCSCGCTIGATQ